MAVSHKNIKRFHIEGQIYDEADIPKIKDQYIQLLGTMMQAKGFVPRFDIDSDFTVKYNGKTFDFILSVYGVFVGRKRAQCLSGVDKNTPIPNSTQKNRSDESWNRAESA